MYLQRLSIVDYRNISNADLTFAQGINCFVGDNGSGKTNTLDAIYYLSFCKSFINSIDGQNVNHNHDFFVIQGWYEKRGLTEEIYCGFKHNQKKQFKRNKKDYQRLADHIGLLPLVSISPGDELLISEGSESRRRFIDSVISQFNKPYLDTLIRHSRVILQRNKLLKDIAEGVIKGHGVLEAIDLQLVALSEIIYKTRINFITEFSPVFNNHFKNISNQCELVELKYESHLHQNNYKELLTNSLTKDLALGYTTKGIHKDDIDFIMNDYQLKKEGSQGQKKSFVISLKLAQFDFLSIHNGIKPILLLDDIFDKLDEHRGKSLLKLVSEDHFNQIFITHTHKELLLQVLKHTGKPYKIFDVNKGQFLELENQ